MKSSSVLSIGYLEGFHIVTPVKYGKFVIFVRKYTLLRLFFIYLFAYVPTTKTESHQRNEKSCVDLFFEWNIYYCVVYNTGRRDLFVYFFLFSFILLSRNFEFRSRIRSATRCFGNKHVFPPRTFQRPGK